MKSFFSCFNVLLTILQLASNDAFLQTSLTRDNSPMTWGSCIPKSKATLGLRMSLKFGMEEMNYQWDRNKDKNKKPIINVIKSKFSAFKLWIRRQKTKRLAEVLCFFSTLLSITFLDSKTLQGHSQNQVKGSTRISNSKCMKHSPITSRGGSTSVISSSSSATKEFLDQHYDSIQKQVEAQAITTATTKTLKQALTDLKKYMEGPKSDTLLLLLATSLITPLCKRLGTSAILGFLAAGMALGPNALGLISGIHTTETLAELGIVFFLFEMGIELSVERLISMKKDVFGLGLSQFGLTALAIALTGSRFNLPANALVVLGGGLALSSSAFVLQLLKDNNQLATRFGKASFGVLLFQDLAVVPLLVVTPILAGGGQGLASALGSAFIKAGIALSSIAFTGRVILNPLFKIVAQANSQEAFLGVILLTVLSMSFMTEGLGLSNTLGAFLAGVLLSETKYRYQIEADIAPFRGILLGLFFVTVGFEIDFHLIASNLPLVSSLVFGILFIKTSVLTMLSRWFGLSLSTALQTGLILSQGGEFAFVAFGLARSLGILDSATTKLMLTSVALTMAVTPSLASLGGRIAKKLEEGSDFTHYLGQDSDANEIKESDNFVVVVGYGAVGRLVCDLLDQKLYKYVGLEINPNKAIQARNQGLPVFYGDIGRPEVAEAFGVDKANAIIITISDRDETNRAVISLRRKFPDKKIFARAANADHAERLQKNLDVIAMVPVVPEDSVLLTLPFGGAVLRSLGAAQEEVNAILESTRKQILVGRESSEDDRKMVLAQLGIDVDQDICSQKSIAEEEEEQTESFVVEVVETSPMVAEVIEAMKEPTPSINISLSNETEVNSSFVDIGKQELPEQDDADSELVKS